jgi:hypothetical protein
MIFAKLEKLLWQLDGNSIPKIGYCYFWPGLIAIPKNTLPILLCGEFCVNPLCFSPLWNFAGISNVQLFLTWEFCANPLCSSSVGNFARISNTQFLQTWVFCVPNLSISPVFGISLGITCPE